MKILIFSDIHIHTHKKSIERLEDCLKVLDWTLTTAKEKNIKNVVFLGDLFHDRQKIDVLAYQRTYEILEKHLLNKDLKLTILLGNHDLWHHERLDISSVNPLRAIENIKIVDKPSVQEISYKNETFYMGFLPYTHNPIEDLKKIEKEWKQDQRKVLGGHIAVDGSIWNTRFKTIADVSVEHEGDMVKVGPEIFEKWDRVFLGHYHASQKLNEKVEYVGSPLELNFGETGQKKHIVVYNTDDDSNNYIENNFSPKHLIIDENQIDDENLKGNFIRLEVEDMTSSQISKIRNKLVEKNISSLEIKQKDKDEKHVVEDAKAILNNEDEMIEQYVKQVAPEGLDHNILIKIGMEICQTAFK